MKFTQNLSTTFLFGVKKMGKATGFMDYSRKANGDVPPMERIENFNEFHFYLDEKSRKNQAARCMNCGVPM